MVVNKRKKFSRQRGSHTHGWGSKKKHRGSGNRGGQGMGGTGKRSDCIKPSIWKDVDYFGKHGFKPVREKGEAINIDDALKMVESGKIKEEGGIVDLGVFGYSKLLGRGSINRKIAIKVDKASLDAESKIKEAGGNLILAKAARAEKKEENGNIQHNNQ